MKIAIVKKIGMSRTFDKDGISTPVSLLSVIPAQVSKINTIDRDKYHSVQISAQKETKINKITEFDLNEDDKPKIGDEIKIDQFETGDQVTLIGHNKGKGFSGVIKKHGFHRGPKTHGSDHHRKTGSIGSMYPQRVVLGKKMPGKISSHQVTEKNLKIIDIDKKNNIISVSGSVPGPNKSILKIMVK